MKLNPEDVMVTSFETSSPFAVSRPTTDDPTPATHCYDCPGQPVEPVTNPGVVIGIR